MFMYDTRIQPIDAIAAAKLRLFLEKPHNLPNLTCFTEVSKNRGNDLSARLCRLPKQEPFWFLRSAHHYVKQLLCKCKGNTFV